jgi:general stress protein YciG
MRGGDYMQITGKGRGFASMDKEKQRKIASRGGVAAHKKGTAHKWTREEAIAAGRKGGKKGKKGTEQVQA